MKKYKVISIIFVIFLFLFSDMGFSQALGRGMGRGMGHWGMGYWGAACPYANYLAPGAANLAGYPYANYPNLLNLTQEQINKLNEIQTKFQSENAALLNNMNQKNLELQALIMSQTTDQTVLSAKIDEINKIQAEIQKKVLAYTDDVRNILTEQQKAIVNSNNLGYGWALNPYSNGLGFGLRAGYGTGIGYWGYQSYGRNVMGGPRLGRGPCGMGLGRGGGWGRLW